MVRRVLAQDLLFVSKSKAETIKGFKAGVSLESRTGYSIDELRLRACADRYFFAKRFLESAHWAVRNRPPLYRVALTRAYYAMYHATRATVYYVNEGDDHEAHSVLPGHLPDDFPKRSYWENELKSARYERNRADYDPYPRNDVTFKKIAASSISTAEELLRTIRRYLMSKGCSV